MLVERKVFTGTDDMPESFGISVSGIWGDARSKAGILIYGVCVTCNSKHCSFSGKKT